MVGRRVNRGKAEKKGKEGREKKDEKEEKEEVKEREKRRQLHCRACKNGQLVYHIRNLIVLPSSSIVFVL